MSDTELPEESGASATKTTVRTSKDVGDVLRKWSQSKDSAFADSMDAVKVAVSFAIAKGHRLSDGDRLRDASGGMSWGITTIDGDRKLNTLVRHLYFDGAEVSDKDVYSAVELLADWALNQITSGLAEGQSVVQIITEVD